MPTAGKPRETIDGARAAHPRGFPSGPSRCRSVTEPPSSRRAVPGADLDHEIVALDPLAGKQPALDLDDPRTARAHSRAKTPATTNPSPTTASGVEPKAHEATRAVSPSAMARSSSVSHRYGRPVERLADDVAGAEPGRARLGGEQEPVAEHGLGHLADVIRRHVLPALDEGPRLREAQERDARPRARAERQMPVARVCRSTATT